MTKQEALEIARGMECDWEYKPDRDDIIAAAILDADAKAYERGIMDTAEAGGHCERCNRDGDFPGRFPAVYEKEKWVHKIPYANKVVTEKCSNGAMFMLLPAPTTQEGGGIAVGQPTCDKDAGHQPSVPSSPVVAPATPCGKECEVRDCDHCGSPNKPAPTPAPVGCRYFDNGSATCVGAGGPNDNYAPLSAPAGERTCGNCQHEGDRGYDGGGVCGGCSVSYRGFKNLWTPTAPTGGNDGKV